MRGEEHFYQWIGEQYFPYEELTFSRLGSGHIHTTFLVERKGKASAVLQEINTSVFPNVPVLMKNHEVLFTHLSSLPQRSKIPLLLYQTTQGDSWVTTEEVEGKRRYFRMFGYIPESKSLEICDSPTRAYEAGRVLGDFLSDCLTLDPSLITPAIPHFQSTIRRFQALKTAAEADIKKRKAVVEAELNELFENEKKACSIEEAVINGNSPVRVTHADTKLNNILFSQNDERGLTLVDFDTCMPGSVLYDIGDLLRNVGVSCAEDEQDFTKIKVEEQFAEQALLGVLSNIKSFITEGERSLLLTTPQNLALTLAARFLTDYLQGDSYFKIQHSEHNLQRARTQLQIAKKFEQWASSR